MGISISERQADALLRYRDMVLEANKKFNLTAITDDKDFVIKHLIDSLVAVNEIPKCASLCDIGAGAGFPSMPLAIVRDDVHVTALDSTAKKMSFVAESAKTLGIKNLNTVIGRAEEQNSHFNKFDVVTARAVSALPILLELSMPLLKVGGLFLAYKTDESELASSTSALKILNAKHVRTISTELPNGDKRAVLVFEKIAKTPPQYPRTYGTIKKKPL